MRIAVTVHGNVLQDVDIRDMRAEMRCNPLAGLDHALQKKRPFGPTLAVYLPLAHLPGRSAYGDVFERSPKTAARMALEVRVNKEGIVAQKIFAHRDLREMHPRSKGALR